MRARLRRHGALIARIETTVGIIQAVPSGETSMSKIDDAANKVKRGTDKPAAATKDAAKAAGNKVKNAGDKIKEQGR